MRETNEASNRRGHAVTYESRSHWKVITQMWGSVWPKVLPYCLLNTLIAGLVQWLAAKDGISLAISDKGHTFMNLLVAFLVVSRVGVTIGRYNEAQSYLTIMYGEARELIQNTVVLSSREVDDKAKAWRNSVAYRTCMLLRAAMGVIDYCGHRVNVWDLPEFGDMERAEISSFLFLDTGGSQNAMKWAHGTRTEFEENLRAPIALAYLLRKELRRQRSELGKALETPQELKLMLSIDNFMVGYHGMRKFLTTPLPFPMVQMARTYLFFYVYTVPFALLSDNSNPIAHCVIIFILTYGFMGLEYVSIELSNPFGDDDNDFDCLGTAYSVFEDIFMCIQQCDGPEWTERLRKRMDPRIKGTPPTITEMTPLMV